ncbi:MAG: GNAT family N-acetyltransferase [Candidatus Hydrogenedentes bacterium]|nr:GNAT family N-acetyltransferase [Candidatus Hydrogenedentota bacterium]
MNGLRLRYARAEDARLLWEWANDPETRRVSFSTGNIPWETHQSWLEQKLNDPRVRFYIVLGAGGEAVAQVRFEIDGGRAVVSVSVAPSERGKGYGAGALRLGAQDLWRTSDAHSIDAYIKPENEVSVRAFANAGYHRRDDCVINGLAAIHMTLDKPPAWKD